VGGVNGAARLCRSPPWPHVGKQAGGECCPPTDVARERRYVASSRAKARVSALCRSKRYRHRRMGMATQSPLRSNHLQPLATTTDHAPASEADTAQAWTAGQPQIAVVARDRGGGYSGSSRPRAKAVDKSSYPPLNYLDQRCHILSWQRYEMALNPYTRQSMKASLNLWRNCHRGLERRSTISGLQRVVLE